MTVELLTEKEIAPLRAAMVDMTSGELHAYIKALCGQRDDVEAGRVKPGFWTAAKLHQLAAVGMDVQVEKDQLRRRFREVVDAAAGVWPVGEPTCTDEGEEPGGG